MSEDKILWHYSRNATQAGKNYASFRSLLRSAIAMAPSTVKFTFPDIEDLQSKLDLAVEALEKYSEIEELLDCPDKHAYAKLALQKIKDSEVE